MKLRSAIGSRSGQGGYSPAHAPVVPGAFSSPHGRLPGPRGARRTGLSAALAAVMILATMSISACGDHMPASPTGTDITAGGGVPTSSNQAGPTPTNSGQRATATSCTSVAHVGDSTSVGLINPDVLPDPDTRVDARYKAVGVETVKLEINGGTSVVETAEPGQKNAFEVTTDLLNSGYKGCWVFALGTNETADVVVGSNVGLRERIDKMMNAVGNEQPVMWLTTKTLVVAGPYADTEMVKWNNELTSACGRYPKMRIFDWRSVVQNKWFQDDEIHFTTEGYTYRAQGIAQALADAFPAGQQPASSCLVT